MNNAHRVETKFSHALLDLVPSRLRVASERARLVPGCSRTWRSPFGGPAARFATAAAAGERALAAERGGAAAGSGASSSAWAKMDLTKRSHRNLEPIWVDTV